MKKSAKFIKEYGLRKKKISSEDVKKILKQQGFSFKEYRKDAVHNELLELLGCEEIARHSNGFTHIDNFDNKIVFYQKGLNEKDLLYVLLHEEGHIYLEHPFKNGLFENSDTQKECEANKFATEVIQYHIRMRNRLCACFIAVLLAVAAICAYSLHTQGRSEALAPSPEAEQSPTIPAETEEGDAITDNIIEIEDNERNEAETTKVYLVGNGDKYHEADCYIIENRSDVKEIDIDTAISVGKTPCRICNPK